jgi:soluble epoxide hydrolase / lipid-phosphate phosphatase
MDPLEEKTITVSRGLVYRYYVSSHGQSNIPALPFCHGFPETAHLWRPLLPEISKLRNKLLIPDLLGFGGSDKPEDAAMYAYHLMAKDLAEICDAEAIDKVVAIGHDHGSGMAAPLYNHFPNRAAGLVLMNVAYQVPEQDRPFDLDAINSLATKAFGYPALAYWNFWTAPDAASILDANLERPFDCAHAGTFQFEKDLYCVDGAMREYMTNPSIPRISTKSYALDESLKTRWMSEFQAGGLRGPLCWYTSRVQNLQHLSDKQIFAANLVVNVPTLFIACDDDVVCRPEMV